MRKPLHAAMRWLAAIACAVAVVAQAQSPALNPEQAEAAKRQQVQQQRQPLNNQPVWSEVRSGAPGITTVRGRETNVLIQSQGQTWRAARVPAASVGGFLFAFALVLLGAIYLWRGPIRVKGAPSGRLIERFTLVERTVHWIVAIAFTTLAVTGLLVTFGKYVLLPVTGHALFSWLATGAKFLHNFIGPVLAIVLPIMIALFLHENILRKYDWDWLRKGGGMLTGRHVPAGKANGGQKLLFWLMAVAAGITLVVTGLILNFPNFDQTRSTMQVANMIHMVVGVLASCLLAGHIYLGTIGVKGALQAMTTGYVDETWAREHHEYWYNEVRSGNAVGDGAPPAGVHRTA